MPTCCSFLYKAMSTVLISGVEDQIMATLSFRTKDSPPFGELTVIVEVVNVCPLVGLVIKILGF